MRLVWLAPLLLVGCAHTRHVADSSGYRPVGGSARDSGCYVIVEPPPLVWREPARLGPAAGSLPYTTDGHNSAYTLTHLR
jgi:hypothetical protein